MSCNCSRYRSIEDMREKYKKDNVGFENNNNNFNDRGFNRCNKQSYTKDGYSDRRTSFLEKDSRLNYR